MAKSRYAALLRGINVGGKNIIPMVRLRESFEAMGFTDVATYIQSGNVVLSANASDKGKLTSKIEGTLTKTFGYSSKIVLVSDRELERVVREAPPTVGKYPACYPVRRPLREGAADHGRIALAARHDSNSNAVIFGARWYARQHDVSASAVRPRSTCSNVARSPPKDHRTGAHPPSDGISRSARPWRRRSRPRPR